MDNDIIIKVIDIIPSLFWAAIIIFILWKYHEQIEGILSSLNSLKIFGVEAEFAKAQKQLELATISYELKAGEDELKAVVNRANRLNEHLRGSRILWVDDTFLANANIFRFLNSYGVEIDKASSTEAAKPALEWGSGAYDAIVTDMSAGTIIKQE